MISVKTSPSFGKFPVMQCRVRGFNDVKRYKATLYKLNPDSPSDFKDVMYSKNTVCIQNDFKNAHFKGDKYNDYYVLQNDATGEVISCAQASHRYRNYYKENPGNCTYISLIGENQKYYSPSESILAYLTRLAASRYDKSVYAPYNILDSSSCSNWHFGQLHSIRNRMITDSGSDGVFIPQRRFLPFLEKYEAKNQINYLF